MDVNNNCTALVNDFTFKVEEATFWAYFNSKQWEPETFDFYKKYASPDKEIIDIGGWIGPTVLIAYSLNPKKITVVEADPANFQVLKNNCKNNYLEDKVDLKCICIGPKSGEIVSFGYTDEAKPDSSTKSIGGTRVKVMAISLLDFLKTQNLENTNIIKIDIEGGETYIEDGLDYISKFKDIIVYLSIHTPFWEDKEKTSEILLKELKKFDVYTEQDTKISLEEVKRTMTMEQPTAWVNKTGLFFTLILKTKVEESGNVKKKKI